MLASDLQPVLVLDEVAGIRVACPYGIVRRQQPRVSAHQFYLISDIFKIEIDIEN